MTLVKPFFDSWRVLGYAPVFKRQGTKIRLFRIWLNSTSTSTNKCSTQLSVALMPHLFKRAPGRTIICGISFHVKRGGGLCC